MGNSSERTCKIVTFWSGIKSDLNLPIDCKFFQINKFSENVIAKWRSLKAKTEKEVHYYTDGTTGEVSYLGEAVWGVRSKADDPSVLSELFATSFDYGPAIQNKIHEYGITFWDARTELAHFIFRLCKRGLVEPFKELEFFTGEPDVSRKGTEGIDYWGLSDWMLWNLDKDVVNRLMRMLNSSWQGLLETYTGWPDDCVVAKHRFLRALSRWNVDGEVDLWISLEAMFAPTDKVELGHQISENIVLFTKDPNERYDTYKALKQRYGLRGTLVHGGDKPSKRDPDQPYSDRFNEFCWLEDIVRNALRRYMFCRVVKKMERQDILTSLKRALFNPDELKTIPPDPAKEES